MAEHLLRVTATDNAVLCYLHLTPSVAKLYGINSCGGNTSIGVMLLQVLEALGLGASVEWYERVPQLSEDATANDKAAALIKKIGRRPGACMKQLDERPEVAPLSRAAVNWRDDVNAARAAHSEGRPTLLGRGTPPPPMSVVRQTLSYPSRIRCPRISDSGDDPVEVVAAGRVGCGAEAATRWPARGRRGRRGRALGRTSRGRRDVGCACGVV